MSARPTGYDLLEALEAGEVRAAEPGREGWIVHAWVKEEILALFRDSRVVPKGLEVDPVAEARSRVPFLDRLPLSIRRFTAEDGVRIVPGGSAVRRGAHLGRGVVCMPPMYVNVGAFVGAGTMVDSHALVGSCAQVGEGVHLSAGAILGGVLEPPGARPVIVEDGAFVGGGAGVYEGVLVGARAVLAAGVVLAAGTPVFDLVHGRELAGSRQEPLSIPPNAVVVPGTRPATGGFAAERGLQLACALIVKYRDARTDAATALEASLR